MYYKKKVEITDDWIDRNPRGTFWIQPLNVGSAISHNKGQFLASGIVFNRIAGVVDPKQQEGPPTYAGIEAILHDENETDWAIYRLEIGKIHKLAFKGIRIQHTSGREIKILAE